MLEVVNYEKEQDKYASIYQAVHNLYEKTGLTDKNGKEIYEGDILDFENSYITEIFWKDNGFRLNDNSIHSDLSHGIIIGNIYEDKNLLK